jgi:hypothetical protein
MKKFQILLASLLFSVLISACNDNHLQEPLSITADVFYEAQLLSFEGYRITSETPKVRRCRVVKRYRPKGEVYRTVVVVENPSNAAFAVVDFGEPLFTGKNPSFNQLIENQNLKMVQIKQGNGNGGKKDAPLEVEFSSDEFLFKEDKNNQTLKFIVSLFDVNGNELNSQVYQVTLSDTGKKPTEQEATENNSLELSIQSLGLVMTKSEFPGQFSVSTEFKMLTPRRNKKVKQLARKAVLSMKKASDTKDFFSSEVMEFELIFLEDSGDALFAKGVSSLKPYFFVGNTSGETKVSLQFLDEFGKLLEFTDGVTSLEMLAKHELR